MKSLWIIVLSTLILRASSYSIEGQWISNNYNNSKLAISAISTGSNGLNSYNMGVEGCTNTPSFTISQSYLAMANLAKPVCNESSGSELANNLQEKFFYFQIYYDQLLLINIYGNKSLSFTRKKADMKNYNLLGVFKSDDGLDVLITNQSFYFCNNSLKVDYLGNSKDSVSIKNQFLYGQCQQNNTNNIINLLQQVEYYRLQNPKKLRFYDSSYSPVLALNKIGNWNNIIPTLQTLQTESNKNSTVLAPESIYIPGDQVVVVQGEESIPRYRTEGGNTPNIDIQGETKKDTSTQNSQQPSAPKNTNQSSSNSTNFQSTSTPHSEQTIKLTFSLAAAVWYPNYFPFDYSQWPSKLAINSTNMAFIGCNTVTIPLVIDYTDLTVASGNNTASSKRFCGQKDQPTIDSIKNATRISSTANDTAFTLTFYNKDNQTLFNISRNYTAAQKKNFIYDTTNPVTDSTIIPPNPATNQTSKGTNIADFIKPAKADSASTPIPSTNNTTSLTSKPSNRPNIVPLGPPGPPLLPPTTNPTSSSSTSNLQTSEAGPNKTPIDSLIGRYNPSKIGKTSLPSALSKNILFVFNPTLIALSGTCNSYKYPYKTTPNGTISIDTGSKLVQENPDCDNSNDQLYLRPLEVSKSYSVISDSNTTLNLFDSKGNPTLSLSKRTAQP